MSDAVLGVVLVGGASRRMGEDKGALTLEGTPMAHRVRRALFDAGVGSVVLVGGDQDGEGTVEDLWPGEGPLGGLATAVLHGAAVDGVEVLVVAACDQPDLTEEVLTALIDALHGAPAEVVGAVAHTSDGRRHPFPSAWRPTAGEPLRALVDSGERRADAAFGVGPIVEVPAAAAALIDLDTPADVAAWIAAGQGAAGDGCVALPRSRPDDPYNAAVDVPEIDIAEAARRHAAGANVIDVREPDEYLEGHVPGAPLIPLGDVMERVDEFPATEEVLIICKMGGRSMKAAQYLRGQGIDAVNIAGGTMAWIDAGHPVVTGDEPGS